MFKTSRKETADAPVSCPRAPSFLLTLLTFCSAQTAAFSSVDGRNATIVGSETQRCGGTEERAMRAIADAFPLSTLAAARILTTVLVLSAFILPSPATAQMCAAVNVPKVVGEWVTLPYQMPINPISATLLHTGKVLIVAGSENDARNNSEGSESYRNAIWDPTGAGQSSISVQTVDYDVFCSGVAALPDGRALVVGDTSDYSFTGENRASIFDPALGQQRFVQSQNMVDGR